MRRWFYVWVLPCLWCPVALAGYWHPGDEYGLWAVSCIAGTWVLMAIAWLGIGVGDIHALWVPASVLAAGGAVMALAGLGLDRLRVRKRLWALVYVILSAKVLAWLVWSYPSIEKALSKNGSWTAYLSASSNAGLTLAVALCLVGGALYRALGRRQAPAA